MTVPKSIIAIQLQRDGFNKPWGFRLQGGAEFGEPLTVQRVFMGSPSEGVIHRGDAIIRINDLDSSRLPLRDAENIINNTALTLRMEVMRNGGPSNPTSPQPMFQRQQSNPYQFQNQAVAAHAQPQQPQQQQPQPAWFGSPTMQAIQRQNSGGVDRRAPRWEIEDPTAAPGIRNLVEREHSKRSNVLDYTVPLPNPDHLSVKNQTYRSNQLITPGPKAKHYRPMGSYLESSFNRRPEPRIVPDNQFATGTRSFNRGQQRPQSVYNFGDFNANANGHGNQYASTNNLSPQVRTGFQRQSSVQPSMRGGWNQAAPRKEIVLGGRQWPPPPQAPSPPPAEPAPVHHIQPQQQVQSNPFNYSNGYASPSQNGSYYNQPQSPQINGGFQRQQSQPPAAIVFNSGQPNRKIIHSTYNSPAGLYSAQNANAMFAGQTGLPAANGYLQVNQPPPNKQLTDFTQSPTYQFLAQTQGQRGGTAWGSNPRQSRALQALVSDL